MTERPQCKNKTRNTTATVCIFGGRAVSLRFSKKWFTRLSSQTNQNFKMKTFIFLLLAMLMTALGRPQTGSKDATILRYNNEKTGIGSYNFAYETSDGIVREESAELKNQGKDDQAVVVRGTVTWIASDGQKYTITYLADENGFQPQGTHFPKGGKIVPNREKLVYDSISQ